MNNLKTLIIQPKEYFKWTKDEKTEKREPIKLKYLFMVFIAVSVINGVVQYLIAPDLVADMGISGIGQTELIIFQCVINIGGPLIGALIYVNILYLVSKIFMKIFEKKEIEDKKYFKNLLYFRYIVVGIVNIILAILFNCILNDNQTVIIVSLINNLFVKLWATYILYSIFKYYVETEKVHKILPIILYIFTIIGTIMSVASTVLATIIPM
ncbi:MAG: hypothetical protein RR835_01580 [Peptostreptococcaceae bacterium]